MDENAPPEVKRAEAVYEFKVHVVKAEAAITGAVDTHVEEGRTVRENLSHNIHDMIEQCGYTADLAGIKQKLNKFWEDIESEEAWSIPTNDFEDAKRRAHDNREVLFANHPSADTLKGIKDETRNISSTLKQELEFFQRATIHRIRDKWRKTEIIEDVYPKSSELQETAGKISSLFDSWDDSVDATMEKLVNAETDLERNFENTLLVLGN